jgi:hypothetical protein
MTAFKKTSIVLALVVLALSSVGVAQAQGTNVTVQPLGRINCISTAVNPPVRAEGLAERVGDFRLDCTNDGVYDPAGFNNLLQYVNTNFTLRLNTAVTNMLNVGNDGGTVTDSVLIFNDNNAWNPIDTSLLPGDFGGCGFVLSDSTFGVPDSRYPCPQKGTISGPSSITWNGAQFPVPGAPNSIGTLPDDNFDVVGRPFCEGFREQDNTDHCFSPVTTVRMTNVRANATSVGAGGEITGTLRIDASFGISLNQNRLVVGDVSVGLITSNGSAIVGLQCLGISDSTYIKLSEGFASAFKTLGAPTFVQGDFAAENGYPVLRGVNSFSGPQEHAGTGGGATQATRFLIRFTNIPEGLTISVSNAYDENGSRGSNCPVSSAGILCVQRVSGTDSDGAGGFNVDGGGSYSVPLDDGAGFVVFEIQNGDPFLPQMIEIGINVSGSPNTAEDEPAIGSGQVTASFAPLSDVGVAANEPKPRFIDTSGDPVTFVTVVRCSTTLLFPFVTNRFGFDTGIAISNTSMDWKGTAPQRGTCRIHYIGKTGDDGPMPTDDVTSIIEGGEQATFTVSMGNPAWEVNGAPDFQGFIVAMCEFQFAHGYAFITDAGGLASFAQGYLALVLQFNADGDRLIACDAGGRNGYRCTSEALSH